VLSDFERILAKSQYKVVLKQLESTLAPDLRTLEPLALRSTSSMLMPKPATGLSGQYSRTPPRSSPDRRWRQHNDANSFFASPSRCERLAHLRRSPDQLIRALPLVANGALGPRASYSPVRSIPFSRARAGRLKDRFRHDLSRREQESSIRSSKIFETRKSPAAQHRRTHRKISRFKPAQQIRRPPPRRPDSPYVPAPFVPSLAFVEFAQLVPILGHASCHPGVCS